MDLSLAPAEVMFRDEVRAFLHDNLPDTLRRAQRLTTTVFSEFEISRAWHKILYRKGWPRRPGRRNMAAPAGALPKNTFSKANARG